jgi:hypothetical protein
MRVLRSRRIYATEKSHKPESFEVPVSARISIMVPRRSGVYTHLPSVLPGLTVGPTSLLKSRRSVLEELFLPNGRTPLAEAPVHRTNPEIGTSSTKCRLRMATFSPPAYSASVVSSYVCSVILADECFLHFQAGPWE